MQPTLSVVGRPARRLLQRDHRSDARLRRRRRSSATRRRAIDPSTLPDPNGATYARKALTGDIGLVANPDGAHQSVRALRPQLPPSESRGDAVCRHRRRAAASLPNVTVEPETGNNFDVGAKFRAGRVQRRRLLLRQPVPELHRAGPGGRQQRRPARSRRRRNFADVRITGVELSARDADHDASGRADADRRRRRCTRGTIIEGTDPLDRLVARRYAVRQHHAVEGDRQRALHASRAAAGGSSTASARRAT